MLSRTVTHASNAKCSVDRFILQKAGCQVRPGVCYILSHTLTPMAPPHRCSLHLSNLSALYHMRTRTASLATLPMQQPASEEIGNGKIVIRFTHLRVSPRAGRAEKSDSDSGSDNSPMGSRAKRASGGGGASKARPKGEEEKDSMGLRVEGGGCR